MLAELLGGNSLVYLPKYVPSDHELFEKSDEKIQDSSLPALDRMYPEFSRDDVIDVKLSRVRSVMAIPTLKYSELLPPMKSSVEELYKSSIRPTSSKATSTPANQSRSPKTPCKPSLKDELAVKTNSP